MFTFPWTLFAGAGEEPIVAVAGDMIVSVGNNIKVMEGGSSTVRFSFSAPGSACVGLACDGTNLISCDDGTNKIYVHSGITDTVTTSFSTPGSSPRDIECDGTDLISVDKVTDKIYFHSGVTSSISSSIGVVSQQPTGVTWDGGGLIHGDDNDGLISFHIGKTAIVTSTYENGWCDGLTFDGTDMWDIVSDSVRKHSSTTVTISSSFALADAAGITFFRTF